MSRAAASAQRFPLPRVAFSFSISEANRLLSFLREPSWSEEAERPAAVSCFVDPVRFAVGGAARVTGRLRSEAVLVCVAPLVSMALPSSTRFRSESLGELIRVQVADTAPDEAAASSMDGTDAESAEGGVLIVSAAAEELPNPIGVAMLATKASAASAPPAAMAE